MAKLKDQLVWHIDLRPLVGKRLVVETHDGHYAEGTLIGFEMSTLKVLGLEFAYPKSLRFNQEEADGIPWVLIKSIRHKKMPKP